MFASHRCFNNDHILPGSPVVPGEPLGPRPWSPLSPFSPVSPKIDEWSIRYSLCKENSVLETFASQLAGLMVYEGVQLKMWCAWKTLPSPLKSRFTLLNSSMWLWAHKHEHESSMNVALCWRNKKSLPYHRCAFPPSCHNYYFLIMSVYLPAIQQWRLPLRLNWNNSR